MITIYKLTAPNGKNYVGQSRNLSERLSNYKGLRCRTQTKLYNSIIKYGWVNFKVEMLEFLPEEPQEYVDEYERYYIKKFDCVTTGLNIQLGGDTGGKTSDETKKKFIPEFLILV